MALAAPGLLFLAAASYLTLERAVTSREGPEGPLDVPELGRLSPGEFSDEKQAAGDAFARDLFGSQRIDFLQRRRSKRKREVIATQRSTQESTTHSIGKQ
jgi:hypothetical protein